MEHIPQTRDYTKSSFIEKLDRQIFEGLTETPNLQIPTATTIVAAVFADGVIMAGDRRATAGTWIASKDIEKVFPADSHSVIGIAGTAGIAIELVRLFQIELEHYEKIEGVALSLDGKANRLGSFIGGNLAMAFEGLVVLPLYAGFDLQNQKARLFSYDVTGGKYEEHEYAAVGSGAVFARNSLKKTYKANCSKEYALRILLESLIDAADDDSATAGPDLHRDIWPVVISVTASGTERISDAELRNLETQIRNGGV